MVTKNSYTASKRRT